jgi:hypothetical protein
MNTTRVTAVQTAQIMVARTMWFVESGDPVGDGGGVGGVGGDTEASSICDST